MSNQNAVLESEPVAADALLQQARAAYLAMKIAEREMSRLRGYRNQTAGMKADFNRHSQSYRDSAEIHDRIMRGAA